jgi:hypothetical protein
MSKQYSSLTEKDREFAARQKMFFIASSSGGEVNLAPKGEGGMAFVDGCTMLMLDYPGSTNRTALDVEAGGNVTVMFCSFDEEPRIMKVFCVGSLIRKGDPGFAESVALFPDGNPDIVRQVIRLDVKGVENGCGLSVPVMRFEGAREKGVRHWAEVKAARHRPEG